MELALSLGDHTSKPFKFLDSNRRRPRNEELGFCMGLGSSGFDGRSSEDQNRKTHQDNDDDHDHQDCPVQLDLLPSSPVHPARRPIHFSWLSDHMGTAEAEGKGLEMNRISAEETELSSPNSGATSYQMGYGRYIKNNKREIEGERGSSRAISDEEDNGLARKKLRLSKQQSAFLEESFKEHNTLNPKQKLALAKQLNLRPRQVEVWFQNRRARTKLKQTEVDCEYLKRCCETLTEENRRLQKELHELRALKTSQPFCMQLPATTLTMCPSCERVVSTPTTTTTASSTTTTTNKNPVAGATASTTPGTSNSTSSSLPANNPKLQAFSSPAQVH